VAMVRQKAVATSQSCADITRSFAWQIINAWVWFKCRGTIRCRHFRDCKNSETSEIEGVS